MNSFKPLAKTAIMQNVKGMPKELNYRTDIKAGDIWELHENSGFYSVDSRRFDVNLFSLVRSENESGQTLCTIVELTDHYTDPFGSPVNAPNGEKGFRLIKILVGEHLTLVIEGNLKKLWHRNPSPLQENDNENS